MYDVNYDEFEPVDPSDGGTYSTAMPERKRHVGLAIGMSLLAVALCAGITAASLFSVRIERRGGSTSVIFTERKSDIPVSEAADAPPVDSVPEPEVVVRHPAREESSPLQELYEQLQPCVASVVPDYSALDNPGAAEGSACTGVVMSADGYIITCYHAIAQTGAVKVSLSDGASYVAAKVGSDPLTDLAVLKIEAEGLTAASFGDSDQLAVGEQVLSLSRGEDARLGSVMTEGIVCALGRDLDFNGRAISVLQTDAGTAGGYGAPIVNRRGEVVGIRVRSVATLQEGELALAVPIGTARSIVDQLIENGFIPGQPTLSFKSLPMPSAARTYYGLPAGAFVESLGPGGAAELAGVMVGDVITGVDGLDVSSFEELDSYVKNNCRAGDVVVLRIYRANLSREVKEFYLELTLDEIRR